MYIGITITVMQLLTAIFIAAYHNVHLTAIKFGDKADADQSESIYNRVYNRRSIKRLVRLMIIEGILLEFILVIVTILI